MGRLVQQPRDGVQALPRLPRDGEYLSDEQAQALAEMGLGSMLRGAVKSLKMGVLKGALRGTKAFGRVAKNRSMNAKPMKGFNAANAAYKSARANPNAPRVLGMPSQSMVRTPAVPVKPAMKVKRTSYAFDPRQQAAPVAPKPRRVATSLGNQMPNYLRTPMKAAVAPAPVPAAAKAVKVAAPKAMKAAKAPALKAPKAVKAAKVKVAKTPKVKAAKVKAVKAKAPKGGKKFKYAMPVV